MKEHACKEIPSEYFNAAESAGEVIRYDYSATVGGNKGQGKYALVYLPPNYDASGSTKYNFLYLSHGGMDRPEHWEKGAPGFTKVLDNMILKGDVPPFVAVLITYLSEEDREALKDHQFTETIKTATVRTTNFWQELKADLMPALEKKYYGYGTRDKRVFGGFSMGGVTTWAVYEHCIAEFKYFMPLSGDCWVVAEKNSTMEIAVKAAEILEKETLDQGYKPNEYYIFASTGTKDIAYQNLYNQIEAMKSHTKAWTYGADFPNDNLYLMLLENGEHNYQYMLQYIYNSLPYVVK
jgi:enterochelin esterase-like enzyme